MSAKRHIILFDGICNLCNKVVQFVIKRDRQQLFQFASLQSEAGSALLKEMNMPEDNFNTVVYICNNKAYIKSDAALKIAASLPFPINLSIIFKIVPKFIRDAVYDFIAKNRYRFFERKAECMIPNPELSKRFLG